MKKNIKTSHFPYNTLCHPRVFLSGISTLLKKWLRLPIATLGNDSTARAFTLIELLVVVLIIGILSAIALPQYRLAVAKSRYATIKNLTNSIAQAEEVYYFANGTYTDNFSKLDIDMPGGKLNTSTAIKYDYDWGSCWLGVGGRYSMVTCQEKNIQTAYRKNFHNAVNDADRVLCMIFGTEDLTDWRNKICQSDTSKASANAPGQNQISWDYE